MKKSTELGNLLFQVKDIHKQLNKLIEDNFNEYAGYFADEIESDHFVIKAAKLYRALLYSLDHPLLCITSAERNASLNRLQRTLQQTDYQVTVLPDPQTWETKQIKLSAALIILLDQNQSSSLGISERVFIMASQFEKPIIPIRVEPVTPPFHLANIQYIDFFENTLDDAFLQTFSRAISRIQHAPSSLKTKVSGIFALFVGINIDTLADKLGLSYTYFDPGAVVIILAIIVWFLYLRHSTWRFILRLVPIIVLLDLVILVFYVLNIFDLLFWIYGTAKNFV